jgi:hypothetical protein
MARNATSKVVSFCKWLVRMMRAAMAVVGEKINER